MSHAAPAHKRILLKLSGEALMGDDSFGINRATIVRMVEEIAEVTRLGVQVAVVIGGGNIFRGVAGGSVGGFLPPNLLALLRLIQIDGHGIRLPNGLSLDDL